MTSYCNTCATVDNSLLAPTKGEASPTSRYHRLAMERVEAIKRDLGHQQRKIVSSNKEGEKESNGFERQKATEARAAHTTTTTTTTVSYSGRGDIRPLSPSQQAAAVALGSSNHIVDHKAQTPSSHANPIVAKAVTDAIVASQQSNRWEKSLRSPERGRQPSPPRSSIRAPGSYYTHNQRPRSPGSMVGHTFEATQSPSAVRRYFDALSATESPSHRGNAIGGGAREDFITVAADGLLSQQQGYTEDEPLLDTATPLDREVATHALRTRAALNGSAQHIVTSAPATPTEARPTLLEHHTAEARLVGYMDSLRQGFFDLCTAMKEDITRLRGEQADIIGSKVRAEVAVAYAASQQFRSEPVPAPPPSPPHPAADEIAKTSLRHHRSHTAADYNGRSNDASYLTTRPTSRRVESLLKEIRFEDEAYNARSRRRRTQHTKYNDKTEESSDSSSTSSKNKSVHKERSRHPRGRSASSGGGGGDRRRQRGTFESSPSSSSSDSEVGAFKGPIPITYREFKDLSNQFYRFRVATHKMMEGERARSDATVKGLEGQVIELVRIIERLTIDGCAFPSTSAPLSAPTTDAIAGSSALSLALRQLQQRQQASKLQSLKAGLPLPASVAAVHTINNSSASTSFSTSTTHHQSFRDVEMAVSAKVMKEVQPLMEHLRRLSGAQQQMQSSLVEDQVLRGNAKLSAALHLVERDLREQAADISALRNDTRQALRSVCNSVGCAVPSL